MKPVALSTGTRCWVYQEDGEWYVEWPDREGQYRLAADSDEYAFTHGGTEYREACRVAWGRQREDE